MPSRNANPAAGDDGAWQKSSSSKNGSVEHNYRCDSTQVAEVQHDVDRVVEIERLAALDFIDYEAARIAAAQRLGVRVSVLEREVAKKRRALGLRTQ